MTSIVYLRIYQTPEGSEYTHHDLFKTGQLSSMIGHGKKAYTLKPDSLTMIVSKSADPSDQDSINMALVKVKNEVPFNPWKAYGDFQCYDVEFLHTKTIKYNCEDSCPSGRIFEIARSIGNGHQNSAKTRELALYMFLDRAS